MGEQEDTIKCGDCGREIDSAEGILVLCWECAKDGKQDTV
jgi:NMD protein affecting ribosome stability and mRNA decay